MQTRRKKMSIAIILVIFFVVNISFLYGYFIIIYTNTNNLAKKNTVDSMISQTTFIINNVDNEISELRDRQLEALQKQSFNILALPEVTSYDMYDVLAAKNDVLSTLRIIITNKAIATDINAYFIDRRIKISAKTTIDHITEKDESFIHRILRNQIGRLIYEEGHIYILTSLYEIGAFRAENRKVPYAFIISEISFDRVLRKIVNSFQTEDNPQFVLVHNDSKKILSSTLSFKDIESFKGLLEDWNPEQTTGHKTAELNRHKYVVSYSASNQLGWTLFELIPEEQVFMQVHKLKNMVIISIFIFLITIILFIISIYVLVYNPVRSLINGLTHVTEGKFTYALTPTISKEFDSLFYSFNKMTNRLYELIEKEYRQKLLIRNSELKQLQLQINPHFLFNTYFILNCMLNNGEYDKAEYMCALLGKYFEYIFYNKSDIVTLEQEMEYARIYCEIQHIRYPRITVQGLDKLPERTREIKVPKLILQPIFENAYKYAFDINYDNGLISVSYNMLGGDMEIIVEDNGSITDEKIHMINKDLEQSDNGKENALINIHQRLKLFFGEAYGVTASRSSLKGLRITLKIRGC